jgi:hypothetical protein
MQRKTEIMTKRTLKILILGMNIEAKREMKTIIPTKTATSGKLGTNLNMMRPIQAMLAMKSIIHVSLLVTGICFSIEY